MATAEINTGTYEEQVAPMVTFADFDDDAPDLPDVHDEAFPPLTHSEAFFLYKAAIHEPDDGDFLEQMEQHHRPDRSTESAAIEKLTHARQQYRRSLLSSVYVLQKSAELLQQALDGERRFDNVV